MSLSPYILEICKLCDRNVQGLQEFFTSNNSRSFHNSYFTIPNVKCMYHVTESLLNLGSRS